MFIPTSYAARPVSRLTAIKATATARAVPVHCPDQDRGSRLVPAAEPPIMGSRLCPLYASHPTSLLRSCSVAQSTDYARPQVRQRPTRTACKLATCSHCFKHTAAAPHKTACSVPVPRLRIGCWPPSGGRRTSQFIGQCSAGSMPTRRRASQEAAQSHRLLTAIQGPSLI